MNNTKKNLMCTFITPLYIEEENLELFEFFKLAMNSIFEQTCPDWSIVFVDDNSNNKLLEEYIKKIIAEHEQTIIYHKNDSNVGPGISRNIAIDIASSLGSDVVVFQDQDDISHPKRIEVTKDMFQIKDIDLLYSYFIPIDEFGHEIDHEDLSYGLKEIVENNLNSPLIGKDIWKTLFEGKMYINLTSTTSVRINYAKNIPFPNRRSSEETYTWLVYSAHGAVFDFNKEIPTKYRIPRNVKGSASRETIGEERWHEELVESFTDAFNECSKCALERGTATPEELKKLKSSLYLNLVTILKQEGMNEMAMDVYRNHIKRAKNSSTPSHT